VPINVLPSMNGGRNSMSPYCLSLLALVLALVPVSVCFGQVPVTTVHMDNPRTNANTGETLLTPLNVNKNSFGFLFSNPIDYQALAQPLYVPGVNINGEGTLHNVVYVVTMADSVYAFDADGNTGSNASPLWWVNFTDPGNGVTTASGANLPCSSGKTEGFRQEGIPGTPVIDLTTNTMYLVVKTSENGTVRLRLHALDITSGQEKFGGPVLIQAISYSNQNPPQETIFNALHQLNRPGLLLSEGTVYVAFGSNGCNDDNSGWMLSYNASNLSQTGVFNTAPDNGLSSVWQSGNGPALDESGNIYFETGEACPSCYNIPSGGQTYSNSVVELNPSLSVASFFTPSYVAFLNTNDLDLSASGVLLLPESSTPVPEAVAVGKQGFAYLLNRGSVGLGGYSTNDSGALQEFPLIPGAQTDVKKDVFFSSPAYWNNTVYFEPDGSPLLAYPILPSGLLGTPVTTVQKYNGAHSPSISANGTSNGILWAMNGSNLGAFNATTMALLYTTNQNKARDALPPVAHFITQTVTNGKVYVATQTTLSVYGLYQILLVTSGDNQSAQVLTTLPQPIVVQVADPYSGAAIAGVTVTFSDGGKKGTFGSPSGVSDANGNVSTSYTFSKTAGVYTITASSPQAGSLAFTETALPGPAATIIAYNGNKQTGQAGSILPNPLKAEVKDPSGNGVPGITVTFTDESGLGTVNPTSAVTNSGGFASTNYQLPNTVGTYKVSGTVTGIKGTALFTEYATSGADLAVVQETASPRP